MATLTKFEAFVEDLCQGEHDFSTDTIKLAFSNASNPPSVSADALLADITCIATTNIDTVTLAVTGHGQTSGTFKLVITDKVCTATGAVPAFQYVILYNSSATTKTNPLIGYYNYGSEVTLALNDTFTVNFDDSNGVFQLT